MAPDVIRHLPASGHPRLMQPVKSFVKAVGIRIAYLNNVVGNPDLVFLNLINFINGHHIRPVISLFRVLCKNGGNPFILKIGNRRPVPEVCLKNSVVWPIIYINDTVPADTNRHSRLRKRRLLTSYLYSHYSSLMPRLGLFFCKKYY